MRIQIIYIRNSDEIRSEDLFICFFFGLNLF